MPRPDDTDLAALRPDAQALIGDPSIEALLAAGGETPSILIEKSLQPPAGPVQRNSWQARHNINGTVVRAPDVGTGHDTIRPVKRLDSAGSHLASTEFVGSLRQRQDSGSSSSGSHRSNTSTGSSDLASTAGTTPNPSNASSAGADSGQEAQLGRALVDEVIGPVIERLTDAGDRKGKGAELPMDARNIEALSMIRKGFEDLAESNPALAWHAMADLLGGISENAAIKHSLATSPLLSSSATNVYELIRKSTIMTERGPAVLLSSVHGGKGNYASLSESDDEDDDEAAAGRAKKEEPRSPIAQMLYARWVLNLREQLGI